jgi:hypothetical protein
VKRASSARTSSGFSIGRKWLAPSTFTMRVPGCPRDNSAAPPSRQVLLIVP